MVDGIVSEAFRWWRLVHIAGGLPIDRLSLWPDRPLSAQWALGAQWFTFCELL